MEFSDLNIGAGVEVVRGIQGLARPLKHPVLTIGNFDGVHRGHQEIIQLAVSKARARGGTAVAFTFRPHPQLALEPESSLPLLTTYDEKLRLLGGLGLDLVIEEPFSREFSQIAPEQFFNNAILNRLSAEAIVVGYDFGFGNHRQGTLEELEKFCRQAGVELTIVPPKRNEGEVVSSSRIRQHLLAGDVETGARLLGREFSYTGVVIRGEGRGRKLGFPTANLKLENKLALPYGVYATHARCEALFPGRQIASVTNIGVRPTFQADRELPALVETHLLDMDADLYGNLLEVSFVRRLREERKFDGIEALKAQIRLDADSARQILGGS